MAPDPVILSNTLNKGLLSIPGSVGELCKDEHIHSNTHLDIQMYHLTVYLKMKQLSNSYSHFPLTNTVLYITNALIILFAHCCIFDTKSIKISYKDWLRKSEYCL